MPTVAPVAGAYGSPYPAYPYGTPYYYHPGAVYGDASIYYPPYQPTYPGYYPYGIPAYDNTNAPSTAPVAGSPTTAQSSYGAYGYGPYGHSPQAYWGGFTGSTAPPFASPAEPSPDSSNVAPDDHSSTPTPTGEGAVDTENTAGTEDATDTEETNISEGTADSEGSGYNGGSSNSEGSSATDDTMDSE
jgi:hypothetical protein